MAGPSCLVGHRVHASKRDVIRLLEDSVEQSAFLYELDLPKEIASDLDLLAEIAEPSNKHSAVAAVSLQKRIAGAFIKRTNFKLLAEGVAHALDLAITSNIGTAQNWASQSWISKAAVSKVTKFWQWELGLLAGIAHAQSRKMSGLQRGSKTEMPKIPCRRAGGAGEEINEMKDDEILGKSGFLLLLIAGAFAVMKLAGWLSWSWRLEGAPLWMLGAELCRIKRKEIK